jgi:MoaA/NifB/PqqE/SkfB family radical SAM enzyme
LCKGGNLVGDRRIFLAMGLMTEKCSGERMTTPTEMLQAPHRSKGRRFLLLLGRETTVLDASAANEHQRDFLENREVRVLLSQPGYRRAVEIYKKANTNQELSRVPVCGAMIDLNSRCNYHCPNCVDQASVNQKSLPPEMPWPILKYLVLDLHSLGCRFIEPMGGETQLYSKYDEFLELAARLNIALKIVTNGSLAHRHVPALVAASKIAGTSIRFSINGSGKTYGALTGVKNSEGAYRKVLNNIGLLSGKGARIIVSYVVFPENVTTIHSAARGVKEKGASEFLVLPGRDWQTKEVLKIDRNGALDKELAETKSLEDNTFRVNIPQTFHDGAGPQKKAYRQCALAFFKPVIGVEGALYPCSYLKQRKDLILSRIYSSNRFREVWESEIRVKKLKNLRPDKECQNISCTRHYFNCFVDGLDASDLSQMDFPSTPAEQKVAF